MIKMLLLFVPVIFSLSVCAEDIKCAGAYEGHLQGIATDSSGNIFWSFTVTLVKTDLAGTVLEKIEVPSHHGDLWVDNETVYVAVNHKDDSENPGKRYSWLYAYNADDLSFLWKKDLPEMETTAGGVTVKNGIFFIVTGRQLKKQEVNFVYEYGEDVNFIEKHIMKSGATYLGIQTIAYIDEIFWFGCYGNPEESIRADKDLDFEEKFFFNTSMGIAPVPGSGYYIGHSEKNKELLYHGWVTKVDKIGP